MPTSTVIADPGRLSQLESLGIIGTQPEDHFDAITELVASVLRVPVVLINFVDNAKTWCKAAWGSAREHRLNAECLCADALENGDELIISDVLSHPQYATHPSASDARKIRFYAAVTLRLPGGLPLGTLCINDSEARMLGDTEIKILRKFSQQIVKHLEALQTAQVTHNLQEQLEVAQRNREQLLAMLAHELRAPLAPILAATQVLQEPKASKKQRQSATTLLERNVRFMSEIVDHLLSASLLSFGNIEVSLEPVAARALLDQAKELSQNIISNRHQTLCVTVVEEPWVAADRTHAPLLIAHLLSNASKYSPDGGEISVCIQNVTDGVEISVTDSGIGIAETDIEAIFQFFGQAEQPLDRRKGGLGLGLALSRRLAEWHRGTLKARSDGLGKGSQFLLTLQHASKPDVASPEGLDQIKSELLDILIVEDNADTAEAIGTFYRISGNLVRIARHAEEAIHMVEQKQPQVVLSDIGLPGMDGYELVRRLKAADRLKQTVYVAITGYGSEQDRRRALGAGFDIHISKPADLKALDTTIASLVQQKRMRGDTST